MRYYPEDELDWEEVESENKPRWMVEVLKKNPNYCSWGNHEDYMIVKGDGWNSPATLDSVEELWELDSYNELVNFYFLIDRDSENCNSCNGSGLNPATKQLDDDWYDFNRTGRKWCYNLTDIEVEALAKEGRINELMDGRCRYEEESNSWFTLSKDNKEWIETPTPEFPTAERVNDWAQKGMNHDSINRWICVEARAKHLGVYGKCETCEGRGFINTEEHFRLALQMWFLHPRKGASRGVLLRNIKQDEVETVIQYLKTARDRNAERFSKL